MKPVVVISGGSDGLGKEIARQLAGSYQVVILSPTEEKLKAAAAEIGADYQVCDVSDWAQVDTAVQNILAKYQKIDVLVNSAGVWIQGAPEANDPAQIKKVIDINTLGTILLTRAFIPTMKNQKSGRIINIISQSGLYGRAERSVYNASKWAITGFTKCLYSELSPFNIGVTGVYPGGMRTKFFEKAGNPKDLPNGIDPVEAAKLVVSAITCPPQVVVPEIGMRGLGDS